MHFVLRKKKALHIGEKLFRKIEYSRTVYIDRESLCVYIKAVKIRNDFEMDEPRILKT